jgi:hydroxypyruvate reductase
MNAPGADGSRWDRRRLRQAAKDILAAGLHAADPARLVARHLRLDGQTLHVGGLAHRFGRKGRLVVVSAGKAASAMGRAAEEALGDHMDEGIAVDSSAPAQPPARLRLRIARHPLPDERGLAAASEVETLARGLTADDLMLVLISGGASALLPSPVRGVNLEDKKVVTSLLQRSGASIGELNGATASALTWGSARARWL